MRIVYDHRIFCRQERGGISRTFIELARELGRRPGIHPRIIAPLHLCADLDGLPPGTVHGRFLPRIPRTTRIRLTLADWLGNRECRRFPADIVHWTYYGRNLSAPAGAVRILTVFDMIHERFPELLPDWEQRVRADKKEAVRRADHLICISEQTRQDLVELLGVDEARTSVIHLGCSFLDRKAETGPSPLDRPYLLYVGSRQGQKNFSRLIQALGRSDLFRRDLVLVCFGGGELNRAEVDLIREVGIKPPQVVHREGDDEQLRRLYHHAQALVYPSLYEGFGLPLVEAMACGCPVVCSRASCLPEVAGDAAAWFDPEDPESIRFALEEVLGDTEKQAAMIRSGRKRARRFTWQRCADQTLEVYRQCRHH